MANENPSYPGSLRSTWSSPDSLSVHLSLASLSWYLWHSCYFFSLISSWPTQIHWSLLRGSFFLLWPSWLLSSLEKPFLTSWAGQIFPLNAPIAFHFPSVVALSSLQFSIYPLLFWYYMSSPGDYNVESNNSFKKYIHTSIHTPSIAQSNRLPLGSQYDCVVCFFNLLLT